MSETKEFKYEKELRELIKDKKFDGIRKIKAYFEKGYKYYDKEEGYVDINKDKLFVLICRTNNTNLIEYNSNKLLMYRPFYYQNKILTKSSCSMESLIGNKLLSLNEDKKVIIEETKIFLKGTLYLLTRDQFMQLF